MVCAPRPELPRVPGADAPGTPGAPDAGLAARDAQRGTLKPLVARGFVTWGSRFCCCSEIRMVQGGLRIWGRSYVANLRGDICSVAFNQGLAPEHGGLPWLHKWLVFCQLSQELLRWLRVQKMARGSVTCDHLTIPLARASGSSSPEPRVSTQRWQVAQRFGSERPDETQPSGAPVMALLGQARWPTGKWQRSLMSTHEPPDSSLLL